MAKIPTPRSYNRIIGDMLDTFLSRLGLKKVKVGSPVLSVFEAAAMSDLRGSQDTFDLLKSTSLDFATGIALDRIAADEGTRRVSESASSGVVTITDSRITKISTRIYQGLPAPIVGSSKVNVTSAALFPATGFIYLGRGTANYEGPLEYLSITNNGNYWTINLKPGNYTTKFHNLGEGVVLAQNGARTIGTSVLCQTPQGNAVDAVQFSVVYPTTIPDGEVEVTNVLVVAKKSGTIGNIPAGTISSFPSPPFPGAEVTNPLPFNNGTPSESDTELRERIRNLRASRSLGTALAIKTGVINITAADENKRVSSASVVTRNGYPTTLYLDDGTGYEERSSGVSIESLNDSSLGGEQFFQLSERPVAKAFLESAGSAPFALSDGAMVALYVGGVLYEHTFSQDDFININNATAYEIAASINKNVDILFSARTTDNGNKVALFAKTDTNEDVEIASGGSNDANDALLFPSGKRLTLRLYKNDRLLTKDGQAATVRSNDIGLWGTITTGSTLTVAVDDTPAVTYTFVDQDFIDANTGFSSVGNNSLAAWAKVLNRKVPGLTATVTGSVLTLTSNRDRSSDAKIFISGGTLIALNVFSVASAVGADSDYTLDRNTAQIALTTPLVAGDRLAAGSVNTRGFLETPDINTVTLAATAHLWMALDGDATVISAGVTPATTFTVTKPLTGTWGARYRFAASGTPFSNVRAGDWWILWDPSATWATLRGMFRVVAATSSYVEIELEDGAATPVGATMPSVGLAIVRYQGQIQDVAIAAGTNYTAQALATAINSSLIGGAAGSYRTNRLRLRTNSFGTNGDTALVSQEIEARKMLLSIDSASNKDSHLGSVESGNIELGTPSFVFSTVITAASASSVNTAPAVNPSPFDMVRGLKNIPLSGNDRQGNNRDFSSSVSVVNLGGTYGIATRNVAPELWQIQDRFTMVSPFTLSANDDLTVVVDEDLETKRFVIPMWRSLRPTSTTYANTNSFKDIGDGNQTPVSLTEAFGLGTDFNDFMLMMKARARSHIADASKSILWRSKRFGAEGEAFRLAYVYPSAASQAVAVAVDPLPAVAPGVNEVNIDIRLPSGSAKIGYPVRPSTQIGLGFNSTLAALPAMTLAMGFPIASATRVGTNVTLTLTLPSGLYGITSHNIAAFQSIWVQSSSSDFPSGLKFINSVTGNTVVYTEAGAATTVASIGTVSYDQGGEALLTGATPSAIAVGDLVRLGSVATGWANQTVRITHIGPQFFQGYTEVVTATSNQALAWSLLADTSRLSFFPINAATATATAIAAAINALDSKCPITAKVMGSGTGVIDLNSKEEFGLRVALVDGLNAVKVSTAPGSMAGDYSFEFKKLISVSAGLTTGGDWQNEEVRLVPATTKNVVEWLRAPGVSGLFSSANVSSSSQGRGVQIASATPGAVGSVQVQGGAANSAVATVTASGYSLNNFGLVSVRTADLPGFTRRAWVLAENESTLPKNGIITSATALTSIAPDGLVTLDVSSPNVMTTVSIAQNDVSVQIEKQGKFICITGTFGNFGSFAEGDFLYVELPSTPGSDVSSVNRGVFRVVRADSGTVAGRAIWIENDNALEEVCRCNLRFISSDSLVPGDVIYINGDIWGAGNSGTWRVAAVNSALSFTLDTSSRALVASGAVAALGSNADRVTVVEGTPMRAFKRIATIVPNQVDLTQSDIKFDTTPLMGSLTPAAGTVLKMLDKLAFPTETSRGADGYQYNTGLIGEAARVVYGDESDSATYPGIIAAGANVNISGPLVRRVQVSLAIRARLGVSTIDISDKVKSAVAAVINKSGIGQSIAISDLVAAASKVNGVLSVTIFSPEYGVGADLISVQPFEKALVLSIDTDVLVSFIGE